jgi:hypothetical protein
VVIAHPRYAMKSPSVKAAHTSFKRNARPCIALKPHARIPYYACRKLDFDVLCNDADLQQYTADELNCVIFEETCCRAARMPYMDALRRVRLLSAQVAAENKVHRRARVVWCATLYSALMAIPVDRRSRCCSALIEILEPLTYWDGTCADVTKGSLLLLCLHQRASAAAAAAVTVLVAPTGAAHAIAPE